MATTANGGHASVPVGAGAPNRGSGRKAPFPHIDDLTSVVVELDPHTPLRKVLEVGDTHMRQAMTFSDFRRPDLALQEYIKAFTIAVDKVPKHKDYPSLKNDRSELGRLYSALKVKLTTYGAKFDKIKEEIKEDNRLSGVQSKKAASEALLLNLPSVPSTLPSYGIATKAQNVANGTKRLNNETSRERSSSSSNKPRPAVHPKPQALHGNAIAKTTATPGSQDLASRFANLRTRDGQNGTNPLQAAGQTRPQPKINSAIPTMPKLPDAIYSPARGTITSEVADLPSSMPRGMFSRANSIVSTSGNSARNSIDLGVRPPSAAEQLNTPQSFVNGSGLVSSAQRIQIPPGTTITPEQLQSFMRKGAAVVRLLLIDVRSRQDFDDGHIMSQATICIEPSVLTRGDISAGDIEESMGIAPDEEMHAFENRAKYDLVVFYDQESMTLPQRPSQDEQDTALYTLFQALVHFNFAKELRTGPKLLKGGVEAWVDIFGRNSLQESQTAVKDGRPRAKRANGFGPRFDSRRRYRAQTRTLKPEEIQQFEQTIKEDEAAASSPLIVRSTEDFLRRYPSASEIQESMTAPVSQAFSHHGFETDLSPSPPTRPAPAVPRTSYSGLSSKSPTSDIVYTKAAMTPSSGFKKPTGLVNTSQNCFANSAIQALHFSPAFAAELTKKEFPLNWTSTIAKKKDPQLMARILGNLFQWLAGRQFQSMRPTTLLKYSRSTHRGYAAGGRTIYFGDGNQHDSSEFLDFIVGQLNSETNRGRGDTSLNYQNFDDELKQNPNVKESELAILSWKRYLEYSNSIIDNYWAMSRCQTRICKTCNYRSVTFDCPTVLDARIDAHMTTPMDLKDLLKMEYDNVTTIENEDGYDCGLATGNKKEHNQKSESFKLARLPPLLCIRILRMHPDQPKIMCPVKFDIDNFDMSPFTVGASTNPEASRIDGFGQGTLYDLYAVINHVGRSCTSGHYYAHIRDGTTKDIWYECDDDKVWRKQLGTRSEESGYYHSREPLEQRWFKCEKSFTPFVLFYKRKDIPWEYAKPPDGM